MNEYIAYEDYFPEGSMTYKARLDPLNVITKVIDEAMKHNDRSVSIYISPDGGMSINVYPYEKDAEEKDD